MTAPFVLSSYDEHLVAFHSLRENENDQLAGASTRIWSISARKKEFVELLSREMLFAVSSLS